MSKRLFSIVMVSAMTLLATTATQAADAFEVDGGHSNVLFRVKHMGVSNFYARFDKIEGKFQVDAADPAATMIDITVHADSVNTKMGKLDAHLKSPDFFSVKEFPTITFKSKSAKAGDDGKIEVTGDLTLHGVTKSITVEVEPTGSGQSPWGGEMAGFECIFKIKRSDYGMEFMLDKLGDEVKLIVSMEGKR